MLFPFQRESLSRLVCRICPQAARFHTIGILNSHMSKTISVTTHSSPKALKFGWLQKGRKVSKGNDMMNPDWRANVIGHCLRASPIVVTGICAKGYPALGEGGGNLKMFFSWRSQLSTVDMNVCEVQPTNQPTTTLTTIRSQANTRAHNHCIPRQRGGKNFHLGTIKPSTRLREETLTCFSRFDTHLRTKTNGL